MNTITCIDKRKVKGCCNAPFKTIIESGIEVDYFGERTFFKKPYSVIIIRKSLVIDDGQNKKTYNIDEFNGLNKSEVEEKFLSCLRGYSVCFGTETTSKLANGQMEVFDINVKGVALNKNSIISILNGDIIPAGIIITSKEIVDVDTVRVAVTNESGNVINPFDLKLSVLIF